MGGEDRNADPEADSGLTDAQQATMAELERLIAELPPGRQRLLVRLLEAADDDPSRLPV